MLIQLIIPVLVTTAFAQSFVRPRSSESNFDVTSRYLREHAREFVCNYNLAETRLANFKPDRATNNCNARPIPVCFATIECSPRNEGRSPTKTFSVQCGTVAGKCPAHVEDCVGTNPFQMVASGLEAIDQGQKNKPMIDTFIDTKAGK